VTTTFSTNGASEEPPPPSRKPLIMFVITAIMVAIGGTAALIFLTPNNEQDLGNSTGYPPGSVTRFASDNFYLVHLDSGEFLALYDRDTSPNERRNGCRIAWRPDEAFDGESGVFRSECLDSAWRIDGSLLQGPSPRDMDRFDTDLDGGDVSVDTGRLLCGEGNIPRGGLNSQCLPFQDERGQ
jgi:hypothetical protein